MLLIVISIKLIIKPINKNIVFNPTAQAIFLDKVFSKIVKVIDIGMLNSIIPIYAKMWILYPSIKHIADVASDIVATLNIPYLSAISPPNAFPIITEIVYNNPKTKPVFQVYIIALPPIALTIMDKPIKITISVLAPLLYLPFILLFSFSSIPYPCTKISNTIAKIIRTTGKYVTINSSLNVVPKNIPRAPGATKSPFKKAFLLDKP